MGESAELTVPVVVLDESVQAADIGSSKGPTDIFARGGRIKQYVKDDALGVCPWDMRPRRLAFDQPFQWASHVTGRPWQEANLAYCKEIGVCNLDCPYCFAKGVLNGGAPTVDVTPTQYLWDFCEAVHIRRQQGLPDPAVCRISGGEPFLFQGWLEALLDVGGPWDFMPFSEGDGEHEDSYHLMPLLYSALWIDTNLTQMPSDRLLEFLCRYETPNVAVCGCFKLQVPLPEQLAIVRAFVEADVELFLYWPCDVDVDSEEDLETFDMAFDACLNGLQSIAHGLPLRICPIEIREDYETVQGTRTRDRSLDAMEYGRGYLLNWSLDHYTAWEVAQPSHLVPLEPA